MSQLVLMSKRNKVIVVVFAILLVLRVAAQIVITLAGGRTPLSSVVNNIQSTGCKSLAEKILEKENATYPFYRCEEKTYDVANNEKQIKWIYVVAGEVERRWEFECGAEAQCATYVGWFEDGELFDFVGFPNVANHDPSIYTLGCGQVNSSSVYDVEINPELVFERGRYWWQIDYTSSPTSTQNEGCIVNGTSLIGYKEALSSIEAEYRFETDNCDKNRPSPCQTAKALKEKSADPCRYDKPRYTVPEPSDFDPKYDFECLSNYIAQIGDTSFCDTKANYGTVSCDRIVMVKEL